VTKVHKKWGDRQRQLGKTKDGRKAECFTGTKAGLPEIFYFLSCEKSAYYSRNHQHRKLAHIEGMGNLEKMLLRISFLILTI
jgi:hypothetical protein